MLAEKPGVIVVNADDEAKRLMVEDESLREALISRFGADTYTESGELNRAGLAAKVFCDEAELAALNALVHPAVRIELTRSIASAESEGAGLFVYEVALLKEIDVASAVDAVLLVTAPEETRIQRVMTRNDATREEVVARMQHQIDEEELRPLSTFVIENNGNLDDLQQEVDTLFTSLSTT